MGQLQKRFENHSQAQFAESPEAKVSWKAEAGDSVESGGSSPLITGKPNVPSVPRWQINALQWGAVVIVGLLLVLFFV